MSDQEDDYLSDKFLPTNEHSSSTKSYSQIRKQALKQAQLKNEQNRHKSRKQIELESRQEGLSTSLFEREKAERTSGVSSSSTKAMSIMMGMGFKPGGTLGLDDTSATHDGASDEPVQKPRHNAIPLPINEWTGKKGIGLGAKRPRSPVSAAERVAKMTKIAEDSENNNFRTRARQEYEDRRAEGRLGPATRTCITFDEKAERKFNVLWLSPKDSTTWPAGLVEALAFHTTNIPLPTSDLGTREALRLQMQADALHPLDDSISKENVHDNGKVYDNELPADMELEEVVQFFRLSAQDRLGLLLLYLRETYYYCFWCGTEYENEMELASQCPGLREEDHD